MDDSFDVFKARKLGEGHDEALVRNWDANFANDPHEHPFDTDAVAVQGEFWLTIHEQTQHYTRGDTFKVGQGVTHSERFGPEGAVFWAARKN